MTQQQRRGAAIFGLVIVGVVTLLLLWLALEVATMRHPLGNNAPGREFMLIISSWDAAGIFLKAIPPAVTVGITVLMRYKLKDWQYYASLAACAAGAACAAYLFFEVSAVATARRFWSYSPVPKLEDYAAFTLAAQLALGLTGAWLIGLLLIQIGVKRGAP